MFVDASRFSSSQCFGLFVYVSLNICNQTPNYNIRNYAYYFSRCIILTRLSALKLAVVASIQWQGNLWPAGASYFYRRENIFYLSVNRDLWQALVK
jgi:hypothetical protein